MRFEDVYVRYCRRPSVIIAVRREVDIRDKPDRAVAAPPDYAEVLPVFAMYMFSHRLLNVKHYKMASGYDRIYSARKRKKMLTDGFISHLAGQTDG